jgi:hypothetical protein
MFWGAGSGGGRKAEDGWQRVGPLLPVVYDWAVGGYYDPVIGGDKGKGLNKNIMDGYRSLCSL